MNITTCGEFKLADLIEVEVNVDEQALQEYLEGLCNDNDTMLEIHNLLAKMCNPYVPASNQLTLANSVEITARSVRYNTPYAHYMYVGEVYGPNIPIFEDGEVVGYFSPPGETKHPTGRQINYNTEIHPLASKEWDKAMLRDRGDEFNAEVIKILVRRANELYG